MKFQFNIIVFAGIFWIVGGIVALFFATKKFLRDSDLRRDGIFTEATVINESTEIVVRDIKSNKIIKISDRDYKSSRHTRHTSFSLEYFFYDLENNKIVGKSFSNSSSGKKAGETVEILYLRNNSHINDLKKNVELQSGYILFWSIGGILWMVFFGIPGFGLLYISQPRNKYQDL